MRPGTSAALAVCVVVSCVGLLAALHLDAPPAPPSSGPRIGAREGATAPLGAEHSYSHTRLQRRAAPEVRVCLVTTGCDDGAADSSTGTSRLVCVGEAGASTAGGSGGGNATTLRACIEWANAQLDSGGAARRIEFAVGVTAVSPTRALPAVTAPHTTISGPAAAGRGVQPAVVHINGAAVPRGKKRRTSRRAWWVHGGAPSLRALTVLWGTCAVHVGARHATPRHPCAPLMFAPSCQRTATSTL